MVRAAAYGGADEGFRGTCDSLLSLECAKQKIDLRCRSPIGYQLFRDGLSACSTLLRRALSVDRRGEPSPRGTRPSDESPCVKKTRRSQERSRISIRFNIDLLFDSWFRAIAKGHVFQPRSKTSKDALGIESIPPRVSGCPHTVLAHGLLFLSRARTEPAHRACEFKSQASAAIIMRRTDGKFAAAEEDIIGLAMTAHQGVRRGGGPSGERSCDCWIGRGMGRTDRSGD